MSPMFSIEAVFLGHWRVRIPIFQFEQISDLICGLYIVKQTFALKLHKCDFLVTKKKSLWP